MSTYLGFTHCPACGGVQFRLEDWHTYVSVTCTADGHKMGELAPAGTPVWTLGQPQPAFPES
jgi:hypothetical protein